MSFTKFNDKGLQSIIVTLDRMPRDLSKFKQNTLKDFQKLLLSNIKKSKTPRNTGEYLGSWKNGSIKNNIAIVETPMGLLFVILELQGRKPGRISKKTAKVLHFQVNGQDVFVAFVDHPGFKEIPHVRPAMKKTLQKAHDIIFGNLGKTFPIFKNTT